MKTLYIVLGIAIAVLTSCKKDTKTPYAPDSSANNNGPYGTVSKWQSIGGDTTFTEALVLTLIYTEKNSPCDICHYQLNYSLWNDYEYTYSASKCAPARDTLIMTDMATTKKAFFKRINN
jgi:hypothetical protein